MGLSGGGNAAVKEAGKRAGFRGLRAGGRAVGAHSFGEVRDVDGKRGGGRQLPFAWAPGGRAQHMDPRVGGEGNEPCFGAATPQRMEGELGLRACAAA